MPKRLIMVTGAVRSCSLTLRCDAVMHSKTPWAVARDLAGKEKKRGNAHAGCGELGAKRCFLRRFAFGLPIVLTSEVRQYRATESSRELQSLSKIASISTIM